MKLQERQYKENVSQNVQDIEDDQEILDSFLQILKNMKK